MSDFDNEKRGVLFRNNDKQTDRSPDYSGRITVDGVEYQLAGWLTESAKGLKYLSIKARIPEPMEGETTFGQKSVQTQQTQPNITEPLQKAPPPKSQTTDQSEIPF
jgi:uncharacterized protein (DUF736 family)